MTMRATLGTLRRRWAADRVVLVGCVLLVGAVATQVAVVGPLQAAGEDLKAQQRAGNGQPSAAQPAGPTRTAEGLNRFHDAFPPADSSARWLETIEAAATRHGIELVSGQYRLERRPGERLARYQMMLPVSGSYAQIRGFMAQVLHDVPAAAIDDVQLRRDEGPGGRQTAGIRLSLHLQAEAGP